MRACDFISFGWWQHLGDNRSDITSDASFVGDQSSPFTFQVLSTPAINYQTPLFFIDLIRTSDSKPIIELNGSRIELSSDREPNPKPSAWQVVRGWGGQIVKGQNTLQIFRDPKTTDDFITRQITIFWQVESSARSTGWVKISANQWQNVPAAGASVYSSPQDLDIMSAGGVMSLNPLPYLEPEHSIIGIYVDDGSGGFPIPYRRSVSGGGKYGYVEFRYVYDTDPNFSMWVTPIVALVSGEWDRDGYIKNTYLPSLKWRLAVIPAL